MNNCFNVNCSQCDDTLVCWFNSGQTINVAYDVSNFYCQGFDGCRALISVNGVEPNDYIETSHTFTGSSFLNTTANTGSYKGYGEGDECEKCGSSSSFVIDGAHIVEYGLREVSGKSYSVIIEDSMSGLGDLLRVYIPSKVISIKKSAFSNCTKLEDVFIGTNVTSVGDNAFLGCKSLKNIDWGCCNNNNKTLSLGNYAFKGCTSLETLNIEDCIKTAKDYCFEGCTSLTNLILGTGLRKLSNGIFKDCSSLSGVSIPSNIKSIGGAAFSGCSSLESIDLSSVTSIGNSAFKSCTSLSSVTLSNDLKGISGQTFSHCFNLANINLNNIKSIGGSAFEGCGSLKSIDLSMAETIGERTFIDCTGLTRATFGENLTTIDDNAFKNTRIDKIELGSNISRIGQNAFDIQVNRTITIKRLIPPELMYYALGNPGTIDKICVPDPFKYEQNPTWEDYKEKLVKIN